MNTEETDGFHTKISIFAGVGGKVWKTGMTYETNFIALMETRLLFMDPL